MTRRSAILLALVIACLGLAAWQWLRPYAWSPDPQARATIRFVRVERDHSFYWLDVYLRLRSGQTHDLTKPVRLLTADGREVEPADTTLEGSAQNEIEALSIRFWLEGEDLSGPLELRINDGTLEVRSGSGIPELESGEARFLQTSRW